MSAPDSSLASSEVLSQSEIERLLAQVAEEQTNAVIHQTDGSKKEQPRESISPYDFRTPVFLTPIELRKLRVHHEEFIQSLAARLSIYLRMEFGLQMAQLHTVPYQKFTDGLTSPTHISLFRVEPMRGICVLEMNPRLGLTIVDRLLGGPGHSVSMNRDLTEIEVALLDQVVNLILSEWCNHWAKYRELRPNMIGHETNARFLNSSPADSVMLVLVIEATMGDCMEQISIGFPYTTLEPLVRQLSQKMAASSEDLSTVPAAGVGVKWRPEYADVPITVTAQWSGLQLIARELGAIKPGDVIPIPANFSEQVDLTLAGKPRYVGRLGTIDGRWAVEVAGTTKG
ncbi:MAG TPA: FliM/FliN family flagellar motor switch protein [Candidatus Limnocylindria bacterium]|jgi:flagellar motor switch protein FliM|nr:FliM/FliN family flagellar motor switch protein [Candidatus Limnocylindria bacterium]